MTNSAFRVALWASILAALLLLTPIVLSHGHHGCRHGPCDPAIIAPADCAGSCGLGDLLTAPGVAVLRANEVNGVRLTVTAETQALIERIQTVAGQCRERHAECAQAGSPGCRDVAMDVEPIANGVVVSQTSADGRTAQRLRMTGGCGCCR